MQLIRYHEMENLLKLHNDIKGTLVSVKYELQKFNIEGDTNSENDFIESMALKRMSFDTASINTKGYTADKTSNIALSYEQKICSENHELLSALQKEALLFQIVVDKIEIGLRALPDKIKSVIELRYFNKYAWIEIETKQLLSSRQAQRYRKEGIEKLRTISRISIIQYDNIIKSLNYKMKG